jgi:transcriptional regulator with XRE-family HTH domain
MANFDIEAGGKMPHNGKRLQACISAQGLTIAEAARRIGVAPQTVSSYYKSASLQLDVWWRVGLALHRNLIAELGMELPVAFESPTEAALKQEVAQLKTELRIYKEIITR